MWIYEQRTGILRHNGNAVATGYSGFDAGPEAMGKNNPAMQDVPEVGPVPQGLFLIGERFDSETHGPVAMRLIPERLTDCFGRSGFLIHGDSIEHPGSASHGCIVLPRTVRILVASSGDDDLLVVEG